MTREKRLQIENELMREYRLWYNPANISDEELRTNISTQKDLVNMLEESYKDKTDDDSAIVLVSEVMTMVIWEDILANRDPNKKGVKLED